MNLSNNQPTAALAVPEGSLQEGTHPVAFGYGSILSELQNDKVKAVDAIVYFAVNYLSHWDSGRSQFLSQTKIAGLLGIPYRFVKKIMKRMYKYMKKIKTTRRGTRYEVERHVFDESYEPDETDGDPPTFGVPHGVNSPIARMFRGDLSWQACLVWIVLRFHSDWVTAVSKPTSMLTLAKQCRLGADTICAAIRELEEKFLAVRLSQSNEAAVYQLYPKPKTKLKTKNLKDDITETKDHWYSNNFQYRCSRKNGIIEGRIGRSKWKRVRERKLHQIPLPIRQFFDAKINIERIKSRFIS